MCKGKRWTLYRCVQQQHNFMLLWRIWTRKDQQQMIFYLYLCASIFYVLNVYSQLYWNVFCKLFWPTQCLYTIKSIFTSEKCKIYLDKGNTLHLHILYIEDNCARAVVFNWVQIFTMRAHIKFTRIYKIFIK